MHDLSLEAKCSESTSRCLEMDHFQTWHGMHLSKHDHDVGEGEMISGVVLSIYETATTRLHIVYSCYGQWLSHFRNIEHCAGQPKQWPRTN